MSADAGRPSLAGLIEEAAALDASIARQKARIESLEAALREIAGDAGPCFFNGCEAPRCVASRALSATEETQGTP